MFVRWNWFGSVGPGPGLLAGEEEEEAPQQLGDLLDKAARLSPPPPYDAPPPYHLALSVWGAPPSVPSGPATV